VKKSSLLVWRLKEKKQLFHQQIFEANLISIFLLKRDKKSY